VYGHVLSPRYVCDTGKYRTTLRHPTLSRPKVFRWHKAFKEGRENVEDDPCSGRPISSTNDENVEVVRAVTAKDRRLRVRMIAEETGLDKSAVYGQRCLGTTSKTGPASPNGHCR